MPDPDRERGRGLALPRIAVGGSTLIDAAARFEEMPDPFGQRFPSDFNALATNGSSVGMSTFCTIWR